MATLNVYDEGQVVTVTATFKDKNKALQDPTTVTLKVQDPTATTPTPYTYAAAQIIKDSQGVYHRDIDTSGKPGKWLVRYESTGQYQTSGDGAFIVRNSPLS